MFYARNAMKKHVTKTQTNRPYNLTVAYMNDPADVPILGYRAPPIVGLTHKLLIKTCAECSHYNRDPKHSQDAPSLQLLRAILVYSWPRSFVKFTVWTKPAAAAGTLLEAPVD